MEIKIGIQYAAREVVIESEETVEAIEKAVGNALDGGLLSLVDRKGRHVMVPGDKITYVEIGGASPGAVGFKELTVLPLLWFLITTLVGGTIVGLLGKFFAPDGKDNIPFSAVIICGVVGMLLGSFVYYGLFGVADNVAGLDGYGWDNTTKGIDFWRHLWQIATAALMVSGASYVLGRTPKN